MQSFDKYASDYDQHFTFSPIGLLQRRKVLHYLEKFLDPSKTILEINCGTGQDACFIAPKVKHITATDISEAMIVIAEKKRRALQLKNLSLRTADIRMLEGLPLETSDLLYSNFAGLNCLSPQELKDFAAVSSTRMKKGALVFVVMLSTKCIWEDSYFFFKKNTGFKRRQNPEGVLTNIEGMEFKTYYYSPRQLCKLFGGKWKRIMLRPIGLFVPPSYLNPFFERHPLGLKMLSAMDTVFTGTAAFSNRADHYMLVLEKLG